MFSSENFNGLPRWSFPENRTICQLCIDAADIDAEAEAEACGCADADAKHLQSAQMPYVYL